MVLTEIPKDLDSGRVVAHFESSSDECADAVLQGSRAIFGLKKQNKTILSKAGSFLIWVAVGFIAYGVAAMNPNAWSIYFRPFMLVLVGAILAFSAMLLYGYHYMKFGQKRRVREAVGKSPYRGAVTVRCHEKGTSWASSHQFFYLPFEASENVSRDNDLILLKSGIWVAYIPEKGFLSAEDREFFIGCLRNNIAPTALLEFDAA